MFAGKHVSLAVGSGVCQGSEGRGSTDSLGETSENGM